MRSDSEENTNQAYRLPDGMFAVTSDQKIKTWNAAAEKMLGYQLEQVIGKKCYDVLCANTGRVKCSRSCVIVTNAAKGRITRDFDLECQTADCKPVSINMSVMLPAQGSGSRDILPSRVQGCHRSSSRRKRIEL
jgi:PAS domain-containing protein